MTELPSGVYWSIAPAVLGIVLFVTSLRCLLQRRLIASAVQLVLAAVLMGIGGLGVGLSINLYTYDRLTDERLVMEIGFAELRDGSFAATLVYPDGSERYYTLAGDEWQLDARVLSWTGAATMLGMDALYRLDRISGRYRDVEHELNGPRTVYALAEDPGLDLFLLAQDHGEWLPWVDAKYGSAVYLPMADLAIFEVKMTRTGLIARPMNQQAQSTVDAW